MSGTAAAGKLSGIRSQFSYAPAVGSPVQMKSLQSWDVDVTVKEIDASDHDSVGWEDTIAGLAKWKATVKGVYFEGDTSQTGLFDAMVAALSGTGNLNCTFLPQKGTVNDGTLSYTGSGIVTSWKHGTAMDGVQTVDLTISGRGALTRATQ